MTTAPVAGTLDAAVHRFHELLGQEDSARATHHRLRDGQRAAGLTPGAACCRTCCAHGS
ncbi:hypothetical protein ACFQ2B_31430 [Streptomyces stramineus]